MQKTLAVIYLLLFMTFCLDSAYGQELWVDRNSMGGICSDNRSREEVSQTTPWCTLGMAGSQAQPGDTVTVRAGNYTEVQTTPESNAISVLQPTVSGSSNAWIRFRAATGEKVSISPQGQARYGIFIQPTLRQGVRPRYIEIAGFEIRDAEVSCIEIFDTSDIVLNDLDVNECSHSAVLLEETERVTLQSSNIHNNPLNGNTSAVDLFRCGGDNVIRGNKISGNTDRNHEEEGHGVIMDTCLDQGSAIIENNEIFENQGWCVVIYASDNASIRNNICKNNGAGGPTSYGGKKGEITTVGSSIDIKGNTIQPRDGSLALNIRAQTNKWYSDWTTIEVGGNSFLSPAQAKIIGVGASDAVTVNEFKATYAHWGGGGQQIDPQSGNQDEEEEDQAIEDEDQVVEDEDQVVEDEDQVIEDEDQVIEDEDQIVEDEDQIVEDEDQIEEELTEGNTSVDNTVEDSENESVAISNERSEQRRERRRRQRLLREYQS